MLQKNKQQRLQNDALSITSERTDRSTNIDSTSSSQPWCTHVSAQTTPHANQCSAGMMSRSFNHNRFLSCSPIVCLTTSRFYPRNRHHYAVATYWSVSLYTPDGEKVEYRTILDIRSEHGTTKNVGSNREKGRMLGLVVVSCNSRSTPKWEERLSIRLREDLWLIDKNSKMSLENKNNRLQSYPRTNAQCAVVCNAKFSEIICNSKLTKRRIF